MTAAMDERRRRRHHELGLQLEIIAHALDHVALLDAGLDGRVPPIQITTDRTAHETRQLLTSAVALLAELVADIPRARLQLLGERDRLAGERLQIELAPDWTNGRET